MSQPDYKEAARLFRNARGECDACVDYADNLTSKLNDVEVASSESKVAGYSYKLRGPNDNDVSDIKTDIVLRDRKIIGEEMTHTLVHLAGVCEVTGIKLERNEMFDWAMKVLSESVE